MFKTLLFPWMHLLVVQNAYWLERHLDAFDHSHRLSTDPLALWFDVPTGKSVGEGSSIKIDPFPMICDTNQRSITTYLPIMKRCASRTKTRLLPLTRGSSNDDKIMVVAEPAIEGERPSPGGGSLDGP